MGRRHMVYANLPRHGVYTASFKAVERAERHSTLELGDIIAQAYEGIWHPGWEQPWPAEYWIYTYPRTVLVIMVGEFNPEQD